MEKGIVAYFAALGALLFGVWLDAKLHPHYERSAAKFDIHDLSFVIPRRNHWTMAWPTVFFGAVVAVLVELVIGPSQASVISVLIIALACYWACLALSRRFTREACDNVIETLLADPQLADLRKEFYESRKAIDRKHRRPELKAQPIHDLRRDLTVKAEPIFHAVVKRAIHRQQALFFAFSITAWIILSVPLFVITIKWEWKQHVFETQARSEGSPNAASFTTIPNTKKAEPLNTRKVD